MKYAEYMQSEQWRARKERYFSTHPRRCHICHAEDAIDLHHLSYRRIGREPDGDLMALCGLHHAAVHEHHRRSGQSLRTATMTVVAASKRPAATEEKPPKLARPTPGCGYTWADYELNRRQRASFTGY